MDVARANRPLSGGGSHHTYKAERGDSLGGELDGLRHRSGEPSPVSPLLLGKGDFPVATNKPRHGYERKPSQLPTKAMGRKRWTKREDRSGDFMSQKRTPRKYKSVRREKTA